MYYVYLHVFICMCKYPETKSLIKKIVYRKIVHFIINY